MPRSCFAGFAADLRPAVSRTARSRLGPSGWASPSGSRSASSTTAGSSERSSSWRPARADRRRERTEAIRRLAIWGFGLLAAVLCLRSSYWPWFGFVESHGGYAGLLRHHTKLPRRRRVVAGRICAIQLEQDGSALRRSGLERGRARWPPGCGHSGVLLARPCPALLAVIVRRSLVSRAAPRDACPYAYFAASGSRWISG